jgi:hypothetical protein
MGAEGERERRIGKLAPTGGPVELEFRLGGGLRGTWDLRLRAGGVELRRWTGGNAEDQDARIQISELVPGQVLVWTLGVHGPARSMPYELSVRLRQSNRSILDFPIRHQGETSEGGIVFEMGEILLRAAAEALP